LEVDKIVKRVGEEEVILASWSVSGGELSWVGEMDTELCSENIQMSDFGKEGNFGSVIVWFLGTFRRQEVGTLVNIIVRSSVS
jgi:hypothetical protein